MPRPEYYPPLVALLWLAVALGELLFDGVSLGEVALAGAVGSLMVVLWWPTRRYRRSWAFALLLLALALALQPFLVSTVVLVTSFVLTLPALMGRSRLMRVLGVQALGAAILVALMDEPVPYAWIMPTALLLAPVVFGISFCLLASVVLFRKAGATATLAATLGSLGIFILYALSPTAQFNGLMVIYLVLFILATTLIASAATFFFVKTLEYLSVSVLHALAWLSPIALGPAFFLYKVLSTASWLAPLSQAALVVAAACLTLLGVWALLAGLKSMGRLLAGRQLVAVIAWKFLRSQRQVLTFRTHGLLALRKLVPVNETVPAGWLLAQTILTVGLALTAIPLSRWYTSDPASRSLIQLGALGLTTALHVYLSFKPASLRTALIRTLLAILFPAWMAWSVAHSHLAVTPVALAIAVSLALLPALVALVRYLVQVYLNWKRTKGMPQHLDPALAPPIVTRIAMGVGPSMFVSLVGVAIGVWALILVLSVMSGFSNELQQRIVKAKDHVMVKVSPGADRLENPEGLASSIRTLPGVSRASLYVEGDAMMSGEVNVSPTVTVRGIDPTNGGLDFLYQILVAGDPDFLAHPEALLPFPGMEAPLPKSLPFPELQLPLDETSVGAALDDTDAEHVPGMERVAVSTGSPSPEPDMAAVPEANEVQALALPTNVDGLVKMPEMEGDQETDAEPETRPTDLQLLPSIVIGRELARALSAPPGTVIQVISPDGDVGPMGVQPRARPFRVAGIFQTGMYEYDLKTGFVLLSEAQRFFNLGNDIGYIDVRLVDTGQAAAVASMIEALVEGQHAEVLTWEAMNRNLFSALKLEQIIMFCVLGFIIIIASFNIVSSLILLIRRRRAAIAILRTMGAGPRHIKGVFLLLGFSAGLFGTFSGVLLGVLSSGLIEYLGITLPKEYYVKSIPVLITGWQVGIVAAASTVVTGLAALYPGRVGSRLGIVQGLKEEA